MKNTLGFLVCALALLAFTSAAQSGGGEASGTFTFGLGTATGTVSFSGLAKNDGTVSGQISLSATVDVSGENCELVPVIRNDQTVLVPVCEPNGITQQTSLPLNLQINCMQIDTDRAAMGGTVTGDSAFAGQHAILAVGKNVVGGEDGFSWGVYKDTTFNAAAADYDFCPYNWTPATREDLGCGPEEDCPIPPAPPCLDDNGAQRTWTASDNELPSDPGAGLTGIPLTPTSVDCESFPLFTYPLNTIEQGGGNKINIKFNS